MLLLGFSAGRIMDNKEICKEDNSQYLDIPKSTSASEDENNCILHSHDDVLNEADTVSENNSNTYESDLIAIRHKRAELDCIQSDLDDLMIRLNGFIADSIDDCSTGEVESLTEKQDGPPEKELKENDFVCKDDITEKMYMSDGSNPPNINWEAVGPMLQKHVAHLQRLHNLNQMTNAVVKRIRNLTQISDTIINESKKKETGT